MNDETLRITRSSASSSTLLHGLKSYPHAHVCAHTKYLKTFERTQKNMHVTFEILLIFKMFEKDH